ncbi:Hypothetical predicted protein, partial [Mytilus galloprovincialis]
TKRAPMTPYEYLDHRTRTDLHVINSMCRAQHIEERNCPTQQKLIEGIKSLSWFYERHATVWIVGSSIIKHAFGEARGRPGGVNLGLQRMGVNIWWQGKCGDQWR